jgi:hypothetical protein
MPALVVAAERVHLIDDDSLEPGEQPPVIDLRADEHRLKGLKRDEQDVGIDLKARQEVVEQRFQRAQLESRQARPRT